MLFEMIQILGRFNYFLGVAGGSIAAAVQSAVYGGAAGSSGDFLELKSIVHNLIY